MHPAVFKMQSKLAHHLGNKLKGIFGKIGKLS